ncbi:hypothetical protein GOBAR_AA15376 [Gossypium barbadense]|uniref:Major facilitator superfamily (MFS) profile domain-containing protein n=1 Tax=Gossypium barbadense TaxID=3634 RepID=A0A2P5XPM3_GOSBA|nr:hypothetical protein GOBAR_AA15376 [Gossypium barbadense]
MRSNTPSLAPGFTLFPSLKPLHTTLFFHQIFVLILTFLAYASFHASRKPPSIVKSVLGPTVQTNSTSNDTGWAPFNGPEGTHRLGELDLAFLTSYAIGMYFAGHVGDRIDLRLFLVFGMMGSGILTIIFGFGYWELVWEGEERVDYGGLDFTYIKLGTLLVVSPDDLGFEMMASGKEIEMSLGEENVANLEKAESEEAGLLENKDSDSLAAIGFLEAWRLPGVAPFSFCLFFSKLVAYTFLYWLPFYIRHTAIAGVHLSHKTAGILSTIFDIGGVLGGVLAGFISDVIDARAVTSVTFLLLSIPALILYRIYGSVSMVTNIGLMFISGLLVNGPYSLITTAVAADLGTQDLIKGNSRALATVTAIIDGTGSVGAALGPLLAGYVSTRGWNSVFLMLIFAIFFASIFLVCVAKTEIGRMVSEEKELGSSVTAR